MIYHYFFKHDNAGNIVGVFDRQSTMLSSARYFLLRMRNSSIKEIPEERETKKKKNLFVITLSEFGIRDESAIIDVHSG